MEGPDSDPCDDELFAYLQEHLKVEAKDERDDVIVIDDGESPTKFPGTEGTFLDLPDDRRGTKKEASPAAVAEGGRTSRKMSRAPPVGRRRTPSARRLRARP